MGATRVTTTSTLADKILLATVFAVQAALANPLEISGVMGVGSNFVCQVINDKLDQGGDQITYHRRNKLQGPGHDEGEALEGFEQAITFDDDSVKVSSKDFTAKIDGPMDMQRTPINLVEETMDALTVQVAEWKSWLVITYLTGKRPENVGTILKANFNGWAGNTLVDVDSNHLMYAGDATAKANLDATDTMVITDLVRMKDKALTLTHKIPPLRLNGRDYHIVLMHPNVWRDVRTANSGQTFFDVEKAMLQGGQDPAANGLINNARAIRDGCIIIVCEQCAIFTDYGAGANVRASRVLFCGPQAAVWARGRKTQKEEWKFVKKKFQYDKQLGICATTIGGCKAVIFGSERHNMLAMDVATAAAA